MPGTGSLAKCQCCCVDRLCSRGETGALRPNWMEQSGRYLPDCFFMPPRTAIQNTATHIERRLEAVKKYYFLTKGFAA